MIATHTLYSPHLRLEVLASGGPRILRLFLAGSDENLLAEVPTFERVPTPWGEFQFYGGHRLWHAPESVPRTYIPDNEGLILTETGDGVLLTRPADPASGIRKQVRIRLHPERAAVTVEHTLTNDGLWPVELAAWAITQLPPGGVTV